MRPNLGFLGSKGLRGYLNYERNTLTPKGPICVFWQHRNLGQVCDWRFAYFRLKF